LLMRRFYNIPGFESSGKSWNFPGSGSASWRVVPQPMLSFSDLGSY
jgi:hypothetical protein